MFACLPFLYKTKAVAVLSVEAHSPSPSPSPSQRVPPQPLRVEEAVVKQETFDDVPQVVRIRQVRIPDALMDIRNPSIKAQLKEFCKENTLCVACSYTNPETPTVLVFNGILHECPHCDSDEEYQ